MKLNKKESKKVISEMQKTQNRKPNQTEKQISSYIKSEDCEIVPIKSDVIFPQNKKIEPLEIVKGNLEEQPKEKRKYKKRKNKKLGKGKYPKKPLYPKNTKITIKKNKKVPKAKLVRVVRGKHAKKNRK